MGEARREAAIGVISLVHLHVKMVCVYVHVDVTSALPSTDQQLNSWDAYSDRKNLRKSLQQNRSHVVGIYIRYQWCFGSCFWVRKKNT